VKFVLKSANINNRYKKHKSYHLKTTQQLWHDLLYTCKQKEQPEKMDAELYSKAVYLTLKNKLLMLKNYIQAANPEYKSVLSAIQNEFKNKIDATASKFNDFNEKFAKSIEYINQNFSIEFKKGAKRLKIEYTNTPARAKRNNKGLKPLAETSEELEKELLSYDSKKYRQNRAIFNACQDRIYSVFNKINDQIASLLDYYESLKGIEEVQNETMVKDVSKKMDLLKNAINDIPVLGFNELELETLSGLLKKASREIKFINANQKASQSVGIEEISNTVIIKSKAKTQSQRVYNPISATKTQSQKIEEFQGHTENYVEYEKIRKGCKYIVEELKGIQKNQFTLESLMNNFLKKDEILAEFRQKCTDLPKPTGEFEDPDGTRRDKCSIIITKTNIPRNIARVKCKSVDKLGFCGDNCDPYCFYDVDYDNFDDRPEHQVEKLIEMATKYNNKRLLKMYKLSNCLNTNENILNFINKVKKEKKSKKIKGKYRRLFRLVSPFARIIGGKFPKPEEYPVIPVRMEWIKNWRPFWGWDWEKEELKIKERRKITKRKLRRLFRLKLSKKARLWRDFPKPADIPLRPVKLLWDKDWKPPVKEKPPDETPKQPVRFEKKKKHRW